MSNFEALQQFIFKYPGAVALLKADWSSYDEAIETGIENSKALERLVDDLDEAVKYKTKGRLNFWDVVL